MATTEDYYIETRAYYYGSGTDKYTGMPEEKEIYKTSRMVAVEDDSSAEVYDVVDDIKMQVADAIEKQQETFMQDDEETHITDRIDEEAKRLARGEK